MFKTLKIFEKAEIRWVCVNDLKKMRPEFRFWYKDTIDKIYAEQNNIKKFILNSLKKGTKKKTLRNKNRSRKNNTRKISTRFESIITNFF